MNAAIARRARLLIAAAALSLFAQTGPYPRDTSITGDQPDAKLPNGKLQSEEILKSDFDSSLRDLDRISKLAGEIKIEMEKNGRLVLSIPLAKKTEEIEKLAKRIHGRMIR